MVKTELIPWIIFPIVLVTHGLKCYQCESYSDPKKHETTTTSSMVTLSAEKGIEETKNNTEKQETGKRRALYEGKHSSEDKYEQKSLSLDRGSDTQKREAEKGEEGEDEYETEEVTVRLQTLDGRPYCDPQYWRKATRRTRRLMESHCPRDRSSFCVVDVRTLPNGTRRTVRGCVGNYDAGGYAIGYGCIFGDTSTVCTCDTDICNAASAPLLHYALLTTPLIYYLLHLH